MTGAFYPVWIDDARTAVDRLRDTCALIEKAQGEPTRWPFESWDDLVSPRAWTLQMASVRFHFARFYLGLATDQARLA